MSLRRERDRLVLICESRLSLRLRSARDKVSAGLERLMGGTTFVKDMGRRRGSLCELLVCPVKQFESSRQNRPIEAVEVINAFEFERR